MIGINLNVRMFILVILSFLLSCTHKNEKKIDYLSFSTSGHDGDSASASAWEIQPNGNVYLHGGSKSPNSGNYIGQLTNNDCIKVFDKFLSLKIDSSREIGDGDYRVGNYFEFEFKIDNKIVIWKGEHSRLPNHVYSFLEDCYKKIKSVKLFESDSLYQYHTKAHLYHNKLLKHIDWKEK